MTKDEGSDDGDETPGRLSLEEVEAELDEIEEIQADQQGEAIPGGPAEPDATEPARPNVARGPSTIEDEGWETDALIVALEMVARLPDDVRLPDSAAELVPVVVEASLREKIENYVAMEFQANDPQIAVLDFEETEEGIWMKLRLGIPHEHFEEIAGHADEIRAAALDRIETIFSQEGPNE